MNLSKHLKIYLLSENPFPGTTNTPKEDYATKSVVLLRQSGRSKIISP